VACRRSVIALAACGVALGCLLGCALALVKAGNSLKDSAGAAAARLNSASIEARKALQVIQESRSGFCSGAEIVSFRIPVSYSARNT
jgi:hypothetical protein